MALQVWLPLLGDLTNNGIYNSTISNVNATITNSGKLGKCYTTNGSNAYITGTYTATVDMSFCIWVKFNSSFAGHLIDARVNDVGYQPMYVESNRLQAGGSTGGFPSFTYTFSTGVWYHLCVVYTQNNVSLYVNGSLVGTSTGGKGYDYGSKEFTLCCRHSHNQYYIPANIQDFRIYDHALSPKEVEILSRGLVVHYPMTGGGRGCANLAKGSNTNSTSTNTFIFSEATGGSTRSIEYDGGIPCAKITRNSTAHSSWQYLHYDNWDRAAIKPSTTYTLSFDIIGSGSGSIGFSGFMQGNATNSISASVEGIQNTFNSDGWSHLVFRTTTIADFTDKGTGQTIYMNCSFLNGVNTWIMMKNMKLEEGVNDTPWTPHTSDAGYSTMGLNDNIEYDVSGYLHNATCTNTSYSSDAARYPVSTVFNKTAYLDVSALTIDMTQVTFAAWFKIASAQTWSRIFDFGSAEGGGYCFGLATGNNGTTLVVYGRRGSSGASLPDKTIQTISLNTWYHAVITLSGTTCKCYVNGTLVISYEITSAYPNSVAFALRYLGKSVFSADKLFDGNISDFRIYGTALSAEDIQKLYNTAVSISNNGTLLAYEFIEN